MARLIFFLFVQIGLGAGLSLSAPNWEVLDEEDAVKVSRRSFPDDGLHEFRGVGLVPAGVAEILALVTDVEKQALWVEGCISAKRIEGNFGSRMDLPLAGYYQIAYGVQGVPWPLNNRDYVLRSTFDVQKDQAGQLVEIGVKSVAVTQAQFPVFSDLVRIPRMETAIKLIPLSPHETRFEFRVLVDPGGIVPHWVVNMVSASVPRKTIVKIRQLLAAQKVDPEYRQRLQGMLAREFKAMESH